MQQPASLVVTPSSTTAIVYTRSEEDEEQEEKEQEQEQVLIQIFSSAIENDNDKVNNIFALGMKVEVTFLREF